MKWYKKSLFLLFLLSISCNIFSQVDITKKDRDITATGKYGYLLRIEGINTPYKRSVFEQNVLTLNKKIIDFQLIELSQDTILYKIKTKAEISELNDIFTQNKHYFDLTVLGGEQTENLITISANWNAPIKATKVKKWNRNPDIIRQIKKIISPKSKSLSSGWIPSRVENEPNNKSHEVNLLPENRLLIGRISSRSDSDIFRVNGSSNKSLIAIKWVRLGKTSLTPQLKLYDEDFNLLKIYRFPKSRRLLRIRYHHSEVPTGKIFIKVDDEIGFIHGETGGYKSYSYLLMFSWRKK